MIHTVTIKHRFSKEKLQRQFRRLWKEAEINSLIDGKVDFLELPPYSYMGINSFKVYGGGDMYLLSVIVNLQTLIMQQNTISLFDCSPGALEQLNDSFSQLLDCLGLSGFRNVTDWYAERIDFAIDVITTNVSHYVMLAKMENRPAWYVDRVDLDGSAYPESKSVTINFYDKADEVSKTLSKVPDYNRLLTEAQNILRLEVQCGSTKLKALQRKTNNDLRLGSFLKPEMALSVVVGYYKRVMGYQDFHSRLSARTVLEDFNLCGVTKKRNFVRWLEDISRYDTLPEAKAAFLEDKGRSSWYNRINFSKEVNVNPITIPDDWNIHNLPNPLSAVFRI